MTDAMSALLEELRRTLAAIYGKRLAGVVLFGSQARGDAESGSDLDVLVVLKGRVSPVKEIERTLDAVTEVSLHYGITVACVFISERQFRWRRCPLMLNVRREGVTF